MPNKLALGDSILYLDPWTGVAGDMLLAALLDLQRHAEGPDDALPDAALPQQGAPPGEEPFTEGLERALRKAVESLGFPPSTLQIERVVERGVLCTRVNVHGGDSQPLRRLAEMEALIDAAGLPTRVRARSVGAIRGLASTEAEVHGCLPKDIHFHELGAVDTLVDIVGTFTLVEALMIDRVVVGPIPVGGGSVEIAHGRMGVPAPATALLLEGYPVIGGPEPRELTTPTGALLVKELGAEPGFLPAMEIKGIGHGAGSMRLDCGPNVLRVILGRALSAEDAERTGGEDTNAGTGGADAVILLESNLDDISPEVVGHTCRLLRKAGALDVWTVAATMKKDRLGVVLHTLVAPGHEQAMLELIFRQTGTLGIRRKELSRWVADRGALEVAVGGSEIAVKWGRWQGRLVTVAPEHDDAAAASAATGLPLKDVMRLATEEAWRQLAPDRLLP